ncbi:hypothetical protein DLAC_04164 [Tieghemostelium lacteum]|uniref:Defective in cullin neddylation protein n=1 Tax=Tieghemostelium lacteum TaxID=361077 RepID=A0A151ZSA2_TIELA|nr:hypothetical protein DLAC_04164 [Tieghemostelium lacteum]|eukprot:KYQ96857.1 hypothetical protein DLAC_04164 [Tieghemostelium lacteum]
MNRLTADQKKKCQDFLNFTESTEAKAIQYLKDSNWNLETACDRYFNDPNNIPESKVSQGKIVDLFNTYKDTNEEKIQENLERFCKDLGVQGELLEFGLLWKFKVKVMGEITKEEFINACNQLKVDGLAKLKSEIQQIKTQLNQEQQFKEFYTFTYDLGRLENQKNVGLDMAIELWSVVMGPKYKDLQTWFEFLKSKHNLAISKDTWALFYDFVKIANDDINKYDSDGAWPVLLDDFVDYLKKK